MKLKEARALFDRLRTFRQVRIKKHAWKDHPERKFTPQELEELVLGSGLLTENKFPSAIPRSFLWVCKDQNKRRVEIGILFEKDDNEDWIIIVHAWRKI